MDWFGAILERIQELPCPTCGTAIDGRMVRGVASAPKRVLIQLCCAACGANCVAILEFEEEPAADETTVAPLSSDDVLDAHDTLAATDAPLNELLGVS